MYRTMKFWIIIVIDIILLESAFTYATATDDIASCSYKRNLALFQLETDITSGYFVPRCEEDGSYSSTQCNHFTGLCWCVDRDSGVKIDNTTVRGIPTCEDVGTEEPICSSAVRYCSPLLCARAKYHCGTSVWNPVPHVCRVNPCQDDCGVQFFNPVDGTGSSCVEPSTMSQCTTQRDLALTHIANSPWAYFLWLERWVTDPDVTEGSYMAPPTTTTTTDSTTATRFTTRRFRPTTTVTAAPSHQLPTTEVRLLVDVAVPSCTLDSCQSFSPKQCHDDYCWCVNPVTGQPVPHSMTIGELICTESGYDKVNRGSKVVCKEGHSPTPCPQACLNAYCDLHHTDKLLCKADPCRNCQITFYNRENRPVCEGMVAADVWDAPLEPVCNKTCDGAVCPGDSSGVCVVHKSSCQVLFLDVQTRQQVNCDKFVGLCKRRNGQLLRDALLNNADDSPLLASCDADGNYEPGQCHDLDLDLDLDERQCSCVEKDGSVIGNQTYTLQPSDVLQCHQKSPTRIVAQMVIVGNNATSSDVRRLLSYMNIDNDVLQSLLDVPANTIHVIEIQEAESARVVIKYSIAVDPTTYTVYSVRMDDLTILVANEQYRVSFVYEGKTWDIVTNTHSLGYTIEQGDVKEERWSPERRRSVAIALIVLLGVFGLVFIIGVVTCIIKLTRFRKKKSQEFIEGVQAFQERYN